MPSRCLSLQSTLIGYRDSGVPLIGERFGTWQPPPADDVGIYYFIPKLASATGWSLQRSIDAFFIGLLLLGLGGGLVGWWRYFESSLARALAVAVMLALSVIALREGDVYIVAFCVAVIVVPWALHASSQSSAKVVGYVPVVLGILAGIANDIRSQSGTAALIFATIIFTFSATSSRRQKVIMVSCLIGGMAIPFLFFRHAVIRRNAFLSNACPQYSHKIPDGHPLWHSVYIGFGYLENDYGIRYKDKIASDKVQEEAPGTPFVSPEYELILRRETFKLSLKHPVFVVTTLAAKTGVVFLVILVFANIGLAAAYVCPKPLSVEAAFWLAIAFSALPGLIAVPQPNYLVGLMAFAASYCVESTGFAVEHRLGRQWHLNAVAESRA
jgi:hypothetical protein